MDLGLAIANKMLDENLTKIDPVELSIFINDIINSMPSPINKITKNQRAGELSIVCRITSKGYDMLSHDINRMACLQMGVQRHLDDLQYSDTEEIKIDSIEVSYLSMKHIWRNSND